MGRNRTVDIRGSKQAIWSKLKRHPIVVVLNWVCLRRRNHLEAITRGAAILDSHRESLHLSDLCNSCVELKLDFVDDDIDADLGNIISLSAY